MACGLQLHTHTHMRMRACTHTHKIMKGNFLEFPWHHEFKASAVVSAIASIKIGHQNFDICINSVDINQQLIIDTCQRQEEYQSAHIRVK